jgi:hypothetical protein
MDTKVGYRGTPEYLPNGASSKVSSENAGTEALIAGEGSEFNVTNSSGDRGTFELQSAAGKIALNLYDYPGWQVDLDGSRGSFKAPDNDGRITLELPAGQHVIHLFHQRNWDAKLGIAISLIAAVFLSSLTFLLLRRNELAAGTQRHYDSRLLTPTVQDPAVPMPNTEQAAPGG